MQKATLIYNDRVYSYQKMIIADELLEKEPTADLVKGLAELRIRNLLCFSELEMFNSTGKFKGMHPLLKHFTVRQSLVKIKKEDPEQFLEEFSNTRDNVKRYSSFLKRDKVQPKQKENWQKQVDKHTQRLELIKEIMSDEQNA